MMEPRFGRPHLHLRRTDSTNGRARELALAGAPCGTVVTADEQSAGRGRRGRRWSAPAGKALLYSAILRPLEERHRLLPLAVPIAVCEAVEELAPLRCAIKWPNDVWILEGEPGGHGRKVAGVLIEARPPSFAVIGIGVNVAIESHEFPPELRWPAASVSHGVEVGAVRVALDVALDRWVAADPARVLEAYRLRDALAGRRIEWEGAGSGPLQRGRGLAEGVDERGNLVAAAEDGKRLTLGAGDVQLRLRAEGR